MNVILTEKLELPLSVYEIHGIRRTAHVDYGPVKARELVLGRSPSLGLRYVATLRLAPSACLTIRVYTFVRHEPYSHHFLYFSPSPDFFYRALHSQFLI